MATDRSLDFSACFGLLEDIHSPAKAPPGEILERAVESSSMTYDSCETTGPSASESQNRSCGTTTPFSLTGESQNGSCGTTTPFSLAGESETSLDEDSIRTRLSETSLQDHEREPPPFESAGVPKVDRPQVPTTFPPWDAVRMLETLRPPRTVTVGRLIQTTAIQVQLDHDFYKQLSRGTLNMCVGLRDLNTKEPVDSGLKGKTFFQSNPPVAGLGQNGQRVLKFDLFTHSMRVKKEGSYRLVYSVQIPDPRGSSFPESWEYRSSGFVTNDCPDFTSDEMEFIEEQERQGHLRLREDRRLDVIAPRSG